MASAILETIIREGDSYLNTSSDASRQKLIASATALIQELENPGEQAATYWMGRTNENRSFADSV